MCDINENVMRQNSESDSDNESDGSFASVPEWQRKIIKRSPLLPNELLSISEKQKRVIFIQCRDQQYHLALNDIRHQATISILVEPSFYGRHSNSSVFVVATADNAYVFDLKALGTIFVQLATLLQAEYPKKIMHHCHRICDLLFKQYNIKVAGICDTFVEWCVASHESSLITLRDAISYIFNIPLNELTCAELDDERTSKREFTGRPLSEGQLKYLAKMAILQQKLHDRLIYENICEEILLMSANLSSEFSKHKMSNEVALAMSPTSTFGFNCIDPYFKISTKID